MTGNRAIRELTVFFPFYNEQENIERVCGGAVDVLGRLGLDWEIILVDDGSGDATGEIADRLAEEDPRIRTIHHRRNRGYGAALRSGFVNAAKEWVFYTDGDGQFDIAQLELLLPLAGKYDIVNGFRQGRRDALVRKINAALWNCLVQGVLRFRARDVDSAFKLYRREIFDRIEMKATGALIDAEILARATRAGYSIANVGVSHRSRTAGKSTGGNPKVIMRAFVELVRLRKEILAAPADRRTGPAS